MFSKAFKVNSLGVASKVKKKPKPFLHPKAKPYNARVPLERFQDRNKKLITRAESGDVKAGLKLINKVPAGPKAPKRVLRSLSGQDYGETISRIGRATRRSRNEYASIVHPLSGRVMDMRRGDRVSASYAAKAVLSRKSTKRMARLAEKAKNPAVRDRAKANVMGENKNIKGPNPVFVHNHPKFGNKAKPHYRRYPSGQDVSFAAKVPNSRHVVLSHKPGQRGTKQTQAVTTRVGNLQNVERSFPSIIAQDISTQRPLARVAARSQGVRESDVNEMIDTMRSGRTRIKSYDTFMRQKTSRKRSKRTGLSTKVTMHKRANPFGVEW